MIQLENVSHDFMHQNEPKRILQDINLSVQSGEVFGLVGNTGSGKSTILRIMNGFIKPTKGSVSLLGEVLDDKNKHHLVKRTAMIFQNFNLLSNLNVLENVLLPTKLRKMDRDKSLEKAKDYLRYVGLEGYEEAYIKTLSGGEKQRVAIARTLMSEPDIIFCDEPTSALDGEMRYDILRLLRDINETMGTTMIVVSHDISVIESLCHQAAILENGKIDTIIPINRKEIKNISYREVLLDD